jgi:Na+/melibiose symporter-like transporter
MIGTSTRLGSLISSSIASFGLAALGYVKGTEPTEKMLKGITALMAIGPATVCLLCCVFMLFYKVNEKELNEYRIRKAAGKE